MLLKGQPRDLDSLFRMHGSLDMSCITLPEAETFPISRALAHFSVQHGEFDSPNLSGNARSSRIVGFDNEKKFGLASVLAMKDW